MLLLSNFSVLKSVPFFYIDHLLEAPMRGNVGEEMCMSARISFPE